MPVLAEQECHNTGRSNFFVHIQNLPPTACRKDIKECFEGLLPIKKSKALDGILIRNNEAFVALEDPVDKRITYFQKELPLLGFNIQLSVISQDELWKALIRCVRRKLDFDQLPESVKKPQGRVQKRKIRPTAVNKGQKRRALSSLTFLPDETNLPSPQFVVGEGRSKRYICGKKKVHPTRISDIMDIENFDVFHPEQCFDAEKIKLDIRAVCTFET